MRRLVSVLVALLATWLGLAIAEPTTAAHSPSVVTSPYVGHYRSVGVTTSTTERGPPSSRDLEITYDSLNPRSEGAAACTRSADTRAVSTYDYPTTLVQVAGVVDTIKRIAGGSAGTSASDELRRVAAKTACFTAGTLVLLADGTSKPIEDIAVGDKVAAYDPDTGKTAARDVVRTFVHHNVPTYDVTLDTGEKVTTTQEHPFWVQGRGWTPASRLLVGDRLHEPDGTTVAVRSVHATGHIETVYNFEVQSLHDYYVKAGNTWILVHNDCGWAVDALSQSGARTVAKDLTRAGQELAKHSGEGAFPIAKGSPSAISRTAQDQLDDILTAPGTSIRDITQGNFPGGKYYIAPDGRGAAFDSSGAFQYFGVFTP